MGFRAHIQLVCCGDFARDLLWISQKTYLSSEKNKVASDILQFQGKKAGTKQCGGFQRGTQTGNYLSHSNERGSGGNGDEWRAWGRREEGERRLLFGTLLCQLLNVSLSLTHTQLVTAATKHGHVQYRLWNTCGVEHMGSLCCTLPQKRQNKRATLPLLAQWYFW